MVTCEICGDNLCSTAFSSSINGTDSACDATDPLLTGSSSLLVVGSSMVGMLDLAVPGRAALPSASGWFPSSAASCIQLSFCWREDPLEEELEGAAVCRLQAAVRAASLSSSGVEIDKTMSWGANFSVMLMKWTLTRAAESQQ
jgi:hypothetical protein